MANTTLRSNYQDTVFYVFGLLCLLLLVPMSSAFQFTVGGPKGWTVPDNTSANGYNQWAEHSRFQIGDSLLFVYNSSQDSVLLVTKDNCDSCTTTNPISTFKDGNTVFTFNHSGPYYFISGNKENCHKNEKLVTIVLADRMSNHSGSTNQTTPASPPSPSSSDIPSPAPSSEESPPEGTVGINPTPAPAANTPSSASSIFTSLIGSIGAFYASFLILLF